MTCELAEATLSDETVGQDEERQRHRDDLADAARRLLAGLVSERPQLEHLARTPARMASALMALTQGYHEDLATVVNGALFDVEYDDVIAVRDIELFSLCEHHVLPFFGKAHIAYAPNRRVLGLSKIPRIVDHFARRLQIQERLTNQIADALQDVLDPRGVAVTIEARHCCLMMRGAQKPQPVMVTRAARGVLRSSDGFSREWPWNAAIETPPVTSECLQRCGGNGHAQTIAAADVVARSQQR